MVDGHSPTANYVDSRPTPGGHLSEGADGGTLGHLYIEPGRPRRLVSSFTSILGGLARVQATLPFTLFACPVCFPSLPQVWKVGTDLVGSSAWASTSRPSRAHNP